MNPIPLLVSLLIIAGIALAVGLWRLAALRRLERLNEDDEREPT